MHSNLRSQLVSLQESDYVAPVYVADLAAFPLFCTGGDGCVALTMAEDKHFSWISNNEADQLRLIDAIRGVERRKRAFQKFNVLFRIY